MEPNLPASAMSATPSNERNPYIHRISDGIPASCPSVKFLKSTFDEVDQHCSLDILPILFEEAQVSSKLKYPFHRSHRVLQRQTSPKVGGKLMQILFDHGTSKDSSVTEKTYETPNNRWRRCKRNASSDSRKVVLLFSVLSIMATLDISNTESSVKW